MTLTLGDGVVVVLVPLLLTVFVSTNVDPVVAGEADVCSVAATVAAVPFVSAAGGAAPNEYGSA